MIATDDEWRRLPDTLGESALADHRWDHRERHPADGEACLPELQLQIEDDPRFATVQLRLQNSCELSSVVTEVLRNRTQKG